MSKSLTSSTTGSTSGTHTHTATATATATTSTATTTSTDTTTISRGSSCESSSSYTEYTTGSSTASGAHSHSAEPPPTHSQVTLAGERRSWRSVAAGQCDTDTESDDGGDVYGYSLQWQGAGLHADAHGLNLLEHQGADPDTGEGCPAMPVGPSVGVVPSPPQCTFELLLTNVRVVAMNTPYRRTPTVTGECLYFMGEGVALPILRYSNTPACAGMCSLSNQEIVRRTHAPRQCMRVGGVFGGLPILVLCNLLYDVAGVVVAGAMSKGSGICAVALHDYEADACKLLAVHEQVWMAPTGAVLARTPAAVQVIDSHLACLRAFRGRVTFPRHLLTISEWVPAAVSVAPQ